MTLFAETDTNTVLWVGLATLIATKFFDWLVLKETNKKISLLSAKVDDRAGELNVKADTAAVKADAAAVRAGEASTLAKRAAQNTVHVFNETKAQTPLLKEIALQTNGASLAKDALIMDLQARIEELLAQQVAAGVVVGKIDHVAETADSIADTVGAPKSGTKLKVIPPAKDQP